MNFEPEQYQYQPEPEPMTWRDWAITIGLLVLVGLEVYYMDSWCTWFTNCAQYIRH